MLKVHNWMGGIISGKCSFADGLSLVISLVFLGRAFLVAGAGRAFSVAVPMRMSVSSGGVFSVAWTL